MKPKLISQLSNEEAKWWENTIRSMRSDQVREPRYYANIILKQNATTKEQLIDNFDKILNDTRQAVWELYLEDEAQFHSNVLVELFKSRSLPREILESLVENDLIGVDWQNKDELSKRIAELVGEYTGRTMPYIYQLSLSTTQSRRSRAGKTFEQIIEAFLDIFDVPFANQSSVGSRFYTDHGLGKKVDAIVPGGNEYIRNRSKCAVVTMKTTLRERWQEVAEELSRTNVPHIYLLTADKTVTNNVIDTIANYNITLVIYESEKNKKFSTKENVISFKRFFTHEMSHIVGYWG